MASHSLEVTNGVTDGVHSHMTHVQAPRWVRKHREDIKLLPVGILGEKNKNNRDDSSRLKKCVFPPQCGFEAAVCGRDFIKWLWLGQQ